MLLCILLSNMFPPLFLKIIFNWSAWIHALWVRTYSYLNTIEICVVGVRGQRTAEILHVRLCVSLSAFLDETSVSSLVRCFLPPGLC